MSDETTQPTPESTPPENQNSEANSIPENPQEPTANAPIPPTDPVSVDVPPQPPESSTNPESAVPVTNDISAPPSPEATAGKQETAHLGASEPLEPTPTGEVPNEPNNPNIITERHGNDVTITEVMEPTAQMAGNEPIDLAEEEKIKRRKENLKLANETRQEKKRKKIDAILDLFAKQTNLTNDEVEKLLHVSDATATRYLETLEKEGKIKQVGETGKGVMYEKI